MSELLHINRVATNRDAFAGKVIEISKKLRIDPNWLMHVMYIESGLNHTAVNPYTGASGLIQFMPATAAELGTTLDKLRSMSNVEQLDYVYKYLRRYRRKYKSYVDLYFAVFFPRAIGKPKNWVLQTSHIPPDVIARQNWHYDLNSDGKITVGELEKAVLKKVPAAYVDSFKKKTDSDNYRIPVVCDRCGHTNLFVFTRVPGGKTD